MKFLHIILSILFVSNGYGSSKGYKQYNLFKEQLCASSTFKIFDYFLSSDTYKIDLEENSACIIEQMWNTTGSLKKFSECRFDIIPTKNNGLIINIKKMYLRQNVATGKCYDYLQIQYSNDTKKMICGEVSNGGIKTITIGQGVLKFKISIDKQLPLDSKLHISMVITSSIPCHNNKAFNEFDLFSCDKGVADEPMSLLCVDKRYVNDGIVNCPAPECLDEIECTKQLLVEPIDSSTVALSAIISLILTTILTTSCLWICYRYQKHCILSCSNSEQTDTELNTIHQPIPSAPPVNKNQDNPPSYDALFPNSS